MITTEPNYQRKSHRVNLPLLIQVNGTTYRTRDWSMTGVGIEDYDSAIEPEEMIDAVLIFPMKDSMLNLNVKLTFKRKHGSSSGFEFTDLGQRNHRILRHYIELAVEGKLDNVEDLVAVMTAPAINTPINEALALSDLEEEGIVHRFRYRSFLTISIGVIFVLLVLTTLFYNTTYRISGTGIISGNLRKISAGVNGVVQQVNTQENAHIKAGQALVNIHDEQYDQQISQLEQRYKQLLAQQEQSFNQSDSMHINLLEEIKEMYLHHKQELARAQKLYKEHHITIKDLRYIENQYNQSAINLARQQESRLGSVEADQIKAAANNRELKELEKRIKNLRIKGATVIVTSPETGFTYNLAVKPGTRVTSGDVVAIIQEDHAPFILLRMLNEDAIKLEPGMTAKVVVPFLKREYEATVTAIGYSAVNAKVSFSQEASQNETLVKMEFLDKEVRLPANTRVKVWIQTFVIPFLH